MEAMIEAMLVQAGFPQATDKLKRSFQQGAIGFGDEELGPRWYMRNVKRFRNLYGVGFFADFVVYDERSFPAGLVIESKQQDQAGSVDEKYVFTVMSLKALHGLYGGLCAWLVFGGDGARAVALDWMRAQEDPPRFLFLSEVKFRVALRNATQRD
jgi:hypothetical protein